MKLSRWAALAATPLLLAGCESFGQAMTAHTDTVARAAGHELKIEEAARLLTTNPELPADPQVVRALTDIWVDYTLLATAAAEDPTMDRLDIDAFVAAEREQMLIWRLREEVIRPDTIFTEAELRERWAVEGPEVQVRARHILLRVPAEATPAERDSVRALAESLRERAEAGEDFAELATEYSQDPGSAARGGDLGFFGRGRMVAPFEEAAFRLQPGEVSPVVESPFGYHVILVEERQQPEMGDEQEEFRQYLVQRVQQEAQVQFIDSLTQAADISIRPGGFATVRELAAQPAPRPQARGRDRVIATYDGGQLTATDFARFLRTQQPQVQDAFATATDEQLEGAIKQLVQRDLLLREAETRGLALSPEEEAELHQEARQAIRQLLDMFGFTQLAANGGGAPAEVEAQVRSLLEDVVSGRRQIMPLGQLSFVLRDRYGVEINESSFPKVVAQMEEIREAQQPALDEAAADTPAAETGAGHP